MGCFDTGKWPFSAAAALIAEGAVFRAGRRICVVRQVLSCEDKPLSSLLLLSEDPMAGDDLHIPLRAVQVRELEDWIAQDRVRFQFGPSALAYNEMLGDPDCNAVRSTQWRRRIRRRTTEFRLRSWRPATGGSGK